MWRPRVLDDDTVLCVGCDTTVSRDEAREYDKTGDRWIRRDKEFEYFCKRCHNDLVLQNRDELEALLCDINAGQVDQRTFLQRYCHAVEDRYGRIEEQ